MSKLLRIYDLEGYKDRKFTSLEEIEQEASENREKGREMAKTQKKQLIGGVWMKRAEKAENSNECFSISFFNQKKAI